MEKDFLTQVQEEGYLATNELIEVSRLSEGDILVIGCSSSEIIGEKIGTCSSLETAQALFEGINKAAAEKNIYLAAQCCEHLNRAIILEKEVAKRERLPIVNVVPQPKAGGSFATTAYHAMKEPVAVEHIKAQAGMDIGDTLIGMHLQEVAVPVRISLKNIGMARLVCARTRAKFIGGSRAVYDEDMM